MTTKQYGSMYYYIVGVIVVGVGVRLCVRSSYVENMTYFQVCGCRCPACVMNNYINSMAVCIIIWLFLHEYYMNSMVVFYDSNYTKLYYVF